jgi:hypothetical protein
MNFTECSKIPLKAFNGLYVNGSMDEVPSDHFVDSRNNAFKKGKFGIRPGSSLRYNIGFPVNNFAEWVTGTFPAPIISIGANGNFYINNSSTPLFTVTGATDFSCVNFYSSLFIIPKNSAGPVGNLLMLYYPQSIISITGVTTSGANATYSYTLVSGPALQSNQSITIQLMQNAGNNITAPIASLGTGTFTIVNTAAVNESNTAQNAGVGTGVNSNNPTIKQCGGAAPTGTPIVATNGAAQTIVITTTGALVPQSQSQSGSGAIWSNLSNIQIDDGQYAEVTLTPIGATNSSNALLLTNLGFNIPAIDTVTGVLVTVHRQQLSGISAARDENISLVGIDGSNNYFDSNSWEGNQYHTYGSNSDTWGLGEGLNPAIINSSSFGVSITLDCTSFPGNGCVAGIDYVTVEVFYATASSGYVPEGKYQIDVVYETDTGFLTPPAPYTIEDTSSTPSSVAAIVQTAIMADPVPNSTSLTITLTSFPTANNTLLFFVTSQGGTVVTPPVGLIDAGNSTAGPTAPNTSLTIYCWKRIAQAGDGKTWTFTFPGHPDYGEEGGIAEIQGTPNIQIGYGGATVSGGTPGDYTYALTPSIGPYTLASVVAFFTVCSLGTASYSVPTPVTPTPTSYNTDGQSGGIFIWNQTAFAAGPIKVTNALGIGSCPVYALAVITPTTTDTSNTIPIQFTASGNHAINLSNIPTGPSGIVARHIIITQADQTEPFWFIPQKDGGVIHDNVTTTTTLDFFATDLIESADYLFNVRAFIPSGQGINVYGARLLLYGMNHPDNSILRLSNSGDPETFDQTKETVIVNKDDGYFVSNNAILRDVLYIWKSKGIFSTIDNGDDPVNWDVQTVDQSVGCSSFTGISTASPAIENSSQSDLLLFSDVSGIYLFNGVVQQPTLTWKIQDLWSTTTDFSKINIIVDTINKRFHITGFNSLSSIYGLMLVGDYNEGVDFESIKWDIWSLLGDINILNNVHLLDNITGNGVQVCTLLSTSIIINFDSTKYSDYISSTVAWPIDQYAITGGQEFDNGEVNLYTGIKAKVTGSGILRVTVYGEDLVDSYVPPPPQLNAAPGNEIAIKTNLTSETAYYRFENDNYSICSCIAVSKSGNNATYTYTLIYGPNLRVGMSPIITDMQNSINNGTFTIIAIGLGTFTVVNSSAIAETLSSGGLLNTVNNSHFEVSKLTFYGSPFCAERPA